MTFYQVVSIERRDGIENGFMAYGGYDKQKAEQVKAALIAKGCKDVQIHTYQH
jgi:hypothetical protein